MKQKMLTIIMVVCLMTAASVMPASAALPDDVESIGLMAMNYTNASAQLSISSTGKATATGIITGIVGKTTRTKAYVYLQQYKNGEWVNIGSWSDEASTVNLEVEGSMNVTKGYKYRVEASCYAYSGSAGEHVTKYSAEVRYNG